MRIWYSKFHSGDESLKFPPLSETPITLSEYDEKIYIEKNSFKRCQELANMPLQLMNTLLLTYINRKRCTKGKGIPRNLTNALNFKSYP